MRHKRLIWAIIYVWTVGMAVFAVMLWKFIIVFLDTMVSLLVYAR